MYDYAKLIILEKICENIWRVRKKAIHLQCYRTLLHYSDFKTDIKFLTMKFYNHVIRTFKIRLTMLHLIFFFFFGVLNCRLSPILNHFFVFKPSAVHPLPPN